MLWTQFSEQFIFENVLLQQLIHEHHSLRMEHMKEAIFTQELPWEALCSSLEIGTSQQARMFSSIKNSTYYQMVVPINLECVALDGDSATMPIIFEDKYVPGKTADGGTSSFYSTGINIGKGDSGFAQEIPNSCKESTGYLKSSFLLGGCKASSPMGTNKHDFDL